MSVGHAINYAWIHAPSRSGFVGEQGTPMDHTVATNPRLISVSQQIDRLKKELDAGPYLQNKLKQYILDNPHMVCLL